METNDSLLTQEDLLALAECGRELATQIEVPALLQKILAKASGLTDSPDASIILYNDRRNSLYFAAAIGEKADFLLKTMGESSPEQIRLESIAGEVHRSGKSQIINAVAADPRHSSVIDQTTRKSTNSMVCVPLIAADERLGVVQLLNKRQGAYTVRDRVLLENFANQAAAAMRNARLVEALVSHMGLYAGGGGAFALAKELDRPVHEEELTVMFADMRGFTRLCQEVRNPALFQRYISEFLWLLAEEVVRHQGLVNKFLGDGLLALFRNGNHAQRAVTCSFKMLERFDALRVEWDKKSKTPLDFVDIGIGIVTDTVMIGSIGGPRLRDFTVFGNPVNLAALLEQIARNGKRIIADHTTYSSVAGLVIDVPTPDIVELKKSDQPHGQLCKAYHLKPVAPVRTPTAQVFLSHNSKDKPAVRELANILKARGIKVWLDEWELIPGSPWQVALEEAITTSRTAAVLVGKDGLGPWEIPEVRVCLSEFISRGMPVIPVLLPGAPAQPDLPLFLKQLTWVDLRAGFTDEGMGRLQWAITGVKPGTE